MESTITRPETLVGWVGKLSPNAMLLGSYQKRFLILQQGALYWSASDSLKSVGAAGLPGCKGTVDFSLNLDCEVSEYEGTPTRFLLKAKGDNWTKGDFTGVGSGRVFSFDASSGSHTRDRWIEGLRAHIAYAATQPLPLGNSDAAPTGGSEGYSNGAAPKSALKSAPPAAVSEADKKRTTPLIQDATQEEIANSEAGRRASALLREEAGAEEIKCDPHLAHAGSTLSNALAEATNNRFSQWNANSSLDAVTEDSVRDSTVSTHSLSGAIDARFSKWNAEPSLDAVTEEGSPAKANATEQDEAAAKAA